MPDPNTADWIIAGASVAGSGLTALAGLWAYKAAKASAEVAREVRAAHAAAVRPNLAVGRIGYMGEGGVGHRPFGVALTHQGETDAVDVEVAADLRAGSVSTGRAASVPAQLAGGAGWQQVALTPLPPGLPADRAAWEPEPLLAMRRSIQRVTVVFADAERRGRWERVFEPTEDTNDMGTTQIRWLLRSERLLA